MHARGKTRGRSLKTILDLICFVDFIVGVSLTRKNRKEKQGYLTGRSVGQEEAGEEEEEEEDVWRAGLEGVVGADGTILAGVKVHCLVV